MGRWGLVFAICMFATHAACAEDATLKALSAKLVAIRSTHGVNTMRDAGPELTPIKHDLRVWVEGHLPELGQHGDAAKLAKKLSSALREARLTCESQGARCDQEIGKNLTEVDPRGYVADIALSYVNYDRYLVVQTNVGVRCGFDTSVYLYEWRSNGWHLALQSEQDRYSEKDYAPQNIFYV